MQPTVPLYPNFVKTYQFKAKVSEIKAYLLCFGSIGKDFTVDNIKKLRLRDTYMISLSAIIPLMPVTLRIFRNI